jgi:hypothetical protein
VTRFHDLVLFFLREKVCLFWYQVCQIVVEGEVEEEANGVKGRLSLAFASLPLLCSLVVL